MSKGAFYYHFPNKEVLLMETNKKLCEPIIEMAEKAVNLGEVNIDDPEAYGISLMGALDGIVSYAMVNTENDITAITNRFEQVWLKKKEV